MIKGASKPVLIAAAGTAALAGIGAYAWHESVRPAVLEIYAFNTPGLPSVFIRTPEDKRILVGGGANADIIRRLTSILPFYSRRLDAVIAPDADPRNVTGLAEAVDRYSVEEAFIPSVTLQGIGLASSSDPAFAALLNALGKRSLQPRGISAGIALDFGEVSLQALFPVPERFAYSKASPPSLILRISYGSFSMLLLGTASPKTQKFVASTTRPLQASVLEISESLTPGNIAPQLLSAAQPEYLVYSQAISKKQASASKKADALPGILGDRRFNIREEGMVKIVSDGKSVELKKSP